MKAKGSLMVETDRDSYKETRNWGDVLEQSLRAAMYENDKNEAFVTLWNLVSLYIPLCSGTFYVDQTWSQTH